MKIKDIVDCLETFAPLPYQEGYDNAGLITGHLDWELHNVLLTLDATEAVIEEAIARQCNLVVAHHPIIFGGLKQITGKTYVERAIIKAIKNDVAIYAAHTNLDNVRLGVNDRICQQLGLQHRSVLVPMTGTLKKLYTFVPHAQAEKVRVALFAAGAGFIGQYSECSYNVEGMGTFKGGEGSNPYVGKVGERHEEPETKIEVIFPTHLEEVILRALLAHHPYEEVAYDIVKLDNANINLGAGMVGELPAPMSERDFLVFLKTRMQTGCVRHTPLRGKPVKKVAVCGGAGAFLLRKAIAAGADAYVSADFKYHDFFDADNQIVVADIGHFESEQFTLELFYHVLTQKFLNFAPLKSQINTNPVNYLH